MNETTITMAGNLTAPAELKFTPTGVAVVNFRIAATARFKSDTGWQDGDTLYLTVTAWRDLAENVAESVTTGTRVIVTGRLKQRTYENREGAKVTVTEIDATDVGTSLQRTTARPVQAERVHTSSSEDGGVCTRCGERHERYGPSGRPCTTRPAGSL